MTGKERLDCWIAARKREADRIFAPEEALLSGRFFRYAARRLIGFGFARSIAVFFHVVELTVLAHIFAARAFVAALALQNLMLVIDSFFWGALEGMRRRVRELGPSSEAAALVTRWIRIAWWVASVAIVLPIGVAVLDQVSGGRPPTMLVVYAIVAAARLGADVVLRTYYSGVFAHTRVFRPIWAMFVGPAILVSVTVLLWDALGGWSFPIATAAAALASRTLLYLFTRRAYERHRVPPPRLAPFLRWRKRGVRARLARRDLVGGLLAGIANATSRLGAVALLAVVVPSLLYLDPAEGGGVEPFAFAMHLAAPFLLLAAQWAFVFYHDHKRLEAGEAEILARQLHRRVIATAFVIGVISWGLTVTLVLVFLDWSEVRDALLALLPLTIGLAVWTAVQLRGFARGDFVTQGISAGAMILVLVAVAFGSSLSGPATYLALALAPWAAVVLHSFIDRWRRARATGLLATYATWRRARAATSGDLAVWHALCADRAALVARRIADDLGTRGAVFRRGDHVTWFERAPHTSRKTWLLRLGGLARELERDPKDLEMNAGELSALGELHARLFPQGFVLRIGARAPAGFLALPARARQEIWHEGLRALRGGQSRSRHAVVAYAPRGAVEALFVAPRPLDPASAAVFHAEWRNVGKSPTPGSGPPLS